ncbi:MULTISPECIES: hypothetical protein [Streptomyces]|uniref:hypothetical protein n=1 Tax=Streptomyces TaxID=1883 RepID=UPI000DFAF8C2|nr:MULTISPECIES: hypothetical protein [Streptomyces]NUW19717.1 hypothetical protein [Streptomyces roseoviolaceus]MBT3074026.1 hypothetical protein [Streptomyces sp. COG21]MBT3083936.1 hypothetical protein [Streptomyces sp. COG20]MBT3090237.1 hypothetical protein [Streptomyces sp. CYG21]MBT3098622.1 hypothetical protein [Streptomyces sp. CBG30]
MTNDATFSLADDQILNNQTIRSIKTLREHPGCSLCEALDALGILYEVLRRETRVVVSGHDNFWAYLHS